MCCLSSHNAHQTQSEVSHVSKFQQSSMARACLCCSSYTWCIWRLTTVQLVCLATTRQQIHIVQLSCHLPASATRTAGGEVPVGVSRWSAARGLCSCKENFPPNSVALDEAHNFSAFSFRCCLMSVEPLLVRLKHSSTFPDPAAVFTSVSTSTELPWHVDRMVIVSKCFFPQ